MSCRRAVEPARHAAWTRRLNDRSGLYRSTYMISYRYASRNAASPAPRAGRPRPVAPPGPGSGGGRTIAVADHRRRFCTPNAACPPRAGWAKPWGVSRTVVREAMRILAAQGLVEVSQGRPPRVRFADSQAVVDTFHTFLQRGDHSLLDDRGSPSAGSGHCRAGRRAGPRRPALSSWKSPSASCPRPRSANEQVDADLRFHDLLAEATGNPIFPLLLRTLAGLMRCSRQKTLARGGAALSAAGHGPQCWRR